MVPQNNNIDSDFKLSISIIGKLILYFILLIPYLFLGFINLIFLNTNKSSEYFSKIFITPFVVFKNISDWFYQAKITMFLVFFLIFTYVIQVLFLNNNELLISSLMVYTTHIFTGNFYSLLTSIFLHGSISHLLTNLLALIIFGRIVEKEFGNKMLYLFVACGVISNLIMVLISFSLGNYFYSLGASGAIAGLIIFSILLHPFTFTNLLLIPLPIFFVGWSIIFMDIINLGSNTTTNHLAHIGGYLAIIILCSVLSIKQRQKIYTGFIINLVMLPILFIVLKILKII